MTVNKVGSLSDFGMISSWNRWMSNFVDHEREQAFPLPPDLRDWLREDDLAHCVIAAVDRVAMSALKVNERGTGSAQHHPRMMPGLLICCHADGILSSRRIERATHRDIGVRLVAANRHPDHDTIAPSCRKNLAAVGEGFLQVVLLARELRLSKVGVASVDGTRLDADASGHRSVRHDRAGALVERLKLEVEGLMARAGACDGSGEEDPRALPKDLARKAALRDRLEAVRARLEAQARARTDAERADHEATVAGRDEREGRAGGRHPKPPDETHRRTRTRATWAIRTAGRCARAGITNAARPATPGRRWMAGAVD